MDDMRARFAIVALGLLSGVVCAETRYVALSGGHVPPFTNWSDAARDIQSAIAVTAPGDLVLVSNGVYDTGGVVLHGILTNRVAITNAIEVRSVNGPSVTAIAGNRIREDNAVRAVYLAAGASLSGFTVRDGGSRLNGGDITLERSGAGVFCESSLSVVSNCVITLNSSGYAAGGTYGGSIYNCLITRNDAFYGGGASGGELWHCTLTNNLAHEEGGGMYFSTLHNCLVTGNQALRGGGSALGTVFGSTLTGNAASSSGGGAYGGTLYNSLIYYNAAVFDPNCQGATLDHCYTTPNPGTGLDAPAPGLADVFHPRLLSGSPCTNAGDNARATGSVDLDGEPRVNADVDIGCDEFWESGLTGSLVVAIAAIYTQAVPGFALDFESRVEGKPLRLRWDFGDGVLISNQCRVSHRFFTEGVHPVTLSASNLTDAASATQTVIIRSPVFIHVSTSGDDAAAGTNWATAKRTIQAGVDAVEQVGGTVLVSNGTYDAGGRAVAGAALTNRVCIDRPMTVRSVGGPAVTTIRGHGPIGPTAIRCAYVTDGATLAGFTLENGHTRWDGNEALNQYGGGVYGVSKNAVVSNCVLTGHAAWGSGGAVCGGTLHHCLLRGSTAYTGGGVFGGTLYNCALFFNSAYDRGGGAADSILYSCTVASNSAYGTIASLSGGLDQGEAWNSILYDNTTTGQGPNHRFSTLHYSCTTPAEGEGCITNPPAFRDLPGGDVRLSGASPCIDAGLLQPWMSETTDLEGNPRLFHGVVDLGAYEFTMSTEARVFLQGSYDPGLGLMRTALVAAGAMPTNSPYAEDARNTALPATNTTDWVLLMLVETNTFTTVAARSALLQRDGAALNEQGLPGVRLEAAPGYYHLAVQHRNHLSVLSAAPLAYTHPAIGYDFTTSSAAYHGGTNAAVEVSPGVWAMRAGDVDGDGAVSPADEMIRATQE